MRGCQSWAGSYILDRCFLLLRAVEAAIEAVCRCLTDCEGEVGKLLGVLHLKPLQKNKKRVHGVLGCLGPSIAGTWLVLTLH